PRQRHNPGATLALELRNSAYDCGVSTNGPRTEFRAWTCLGSSGINAGSGSRAKPSDEMEVRREGLSLNVKSATSRAPEASRRAASVVRAVCEEWRSGVIAGPT